MAESWKGPHNVTAVISELRDVIDGLLEDFWAVFKTRIYRTCSIDIKIPKTIWRFMATRLF